MNSIQPLILKKQEERRIQAGHLWVYSNEIDTKLSPLNKYKPGNLVAVVDSKNKFLGYGYINPHTLICARVLTTNSKQSIDTGFFEQRIAQAQCLRERIFSEPYYRLVYSESDGLPGLIIDRFDNNFVMQISTAGMERLLNYIILAMQNLFPNANILAKNDLPARKMEGLELEDKCLSGELPPHLTVLENGVTFLAPVFSGQKTGWFFDQRANRALLQKYVVNKEVLDVCCYLGAFGIQAACFGAAKVTCVDASATALTALENNAKLNNVENKISTINSDAFDALKQLILDKKNYDVIILDPPAFIKNRAQIKNGIQGYLKLHNLALQLLKPGGILFSASCSMHLSHDDLIDVVRKSALQQQKFVRLIEQLLQDSDHPIHPAIKETKYLKGIVAFIQ